MEQVDEKTQKGIKLIQKILTDVGEKKIITALTLMKNGKMSDAELMGILDLGTSNSAAYYRKELEKEGIIKGYTEDVKIALNHAKKIVDKFPDKNIIVTADHGELLGEHGRYSHVLDRYYKEIVEVPWLEIKGGRK